MRPLDLTFARLCDLTPMGDVALLSSKSCWSARAEASVGSGVGRRAELVPEELNVTDTEQYQVVIVGAGFAGIACAKELAKHDIRVAVIDRNNYHQFQPLLYQVARHGRTSCQPCR